MQYPFSLNPSSKAQFEKMNKILVNAFKHINAFKFENAISACNKRRAANAAASADAADDDAPGSLLLSSISLITPKTTNFSVC